MDGEGNGTPLQSLAWKNPMDGGAWWAAVHGVAKSRTRLKRLSRAMEGDRGKLSHQNDDRGDSNIMNNSLPNLQRNVLWGNYLPCFQITFCYISK